MPKVKRIKSTGQSVVVENYLNERVAIPADKLRETKDGFEVSRDVLDAGILLDDLSFIEIVPLKKEVLLKELYRRDIRTAEDVIAHPQSTMSAIQEACGISLSTVLVSAKAYVKLKGEK